MGIRRKVVIGSAIAAGTGFACAGAVTLTLAKGRQLRSNQLRGKVVLITGASRGLGLAMAEEFGKKGARLALAARDAEELYRARTLLLQRGAAKNTEDISVFPSDLRKPEDAEKLIQETTKHFAQVDILINNAGIITAGPVENQSIEDFKSVMETNFFSGLYCALSVLPQMLARREGAIVNIASLGGKIAVPHMLPYTASKFAVVGFSEGLNAELRTKGIRVTTVCPGLMRTGSHLNALFKGDAEREYRWFSLAASLPGVSISARSAARKIVRAVIAGKGEIAITPQAELAGRLGHLSPQTTMRIMQLMNLTLPAAVDEPTATRRGSEVRALELTWAVALGNAASRYYNQVQ
jgi:short-subunit dehydrogenase